MFLSKGGNERAKITSTSTVVRAKQVIPVGLEDLSDDARSQQKSVQVCGGCVAGRRVGRAHHDMVSPSEAHLTSVSSVQAVVACYSL